MDTKVGGVVMKLDEGKIRQFLSGQGLSTKRSEKLARLMAKEDLFVEEKKEIVSRTVFREISEVKED
jgi:hypothetical protein